ncbi:hypothetical protein [Bacteroides sp.]|uniref:hypothetical protein n=1 Tax=Bacteroides sp. TaxID=29523 RepID=UPI003D0BD252
MKKNLSLLIMFLLIQISGINANASETPSYEELMNVTLSKLNNSTTPDRYTTCIAELKRISAIYPEEWLTYYYVSLYEIQHTFNNHSSNNDDLLNVSHRSTPSAKHLHYRDAIVFRSSQ